MKQMVSGDLQISLKTGVPSKAPDIFIGTGLFPTYFWGFVGNYDIDVGGNDI